MSENAQALALISEYLKTRKVMIAEPSPTFSTTIFQIMTKLGALHENVFKEATFEKAVVALREKPEIIISEYHIGKNFGLELAALQAEYLSDEKERAFILATANNNDSAIAEAAEEEVDGYVLKPFTFNQLQSLLISIIQRKANPSEYSQKIQAGKAHLKSEEYNEAATVFGQAKKLAEKPALACYYYGHSNFKLKEKDVALKSFREGRRYNPLHYKCLHGEFDILFERNEQKAAYDILKVISDHFPVSPATLEKMFTLAIFTKNYEDLDTYFDFFLNIERRSERLIKVVTEALFFSGRFFIKNKNLPRALDRFRKASTVSRRSPEFLKRVIEVLLKDKRHTEAEEFLNMFSMDERESKTFLELDFEVSKNSLQPHELIAKGKKLIDDGIATPDICKVVIQALVSQNKETLAEQLSFKATQLFPDQREEFYSLLKVA